METGVLPNSWFPCRSGTSLFSGSTPSRDAILTQLCPKSEMIGINSYGEFEVTPFLEMRMLSGLRSSCTLPKRVTWSVQCSILPCGGRWSASFPVGNCRRILPPVNLTSLIFGIIARHRPVKADEPLPNPSHTLPEQPGIMSCGRPRRILKVLSQVATINIPQHKVVSATLHKRTMVADYVWVSKILDSC